MRTICILLCAVACPAIAETLSNIISKTSSGTESAEGTTVLSASFVTGSASSVLTSVSLLLANSSAGQAQVSIYSDGGLKPGTLVGTLTSPSTYSTSAASTTFTSSGITLSANTTYWVVLKALSGRFDWSWTSDNTGEGTGFLHIWGVSADSGTTWYNFDLYPLQLLVTTSSAGTCSYALGSTASSLAAASANGSTTVTTMSSCAWTAVSNAAWITVTSGASGTGSGTVNYSVTANTTTAARTGTITIGGQSLTITQAAAAMACNYSLSATATTAPAAGNTGVVTVTTTSGCAWTAVSNATWISITSGASVSASGDVAFTIASNSTGASRIGTITVAGSTFTVTQLTASSTGLTFVPVTPCRVADTRLATGAFGGPRLNTSETRSFVIPSSSCGIPSTAAAYALNVTVVPVGALSFLTLYPTGQTQRAVSTLNSFDGRIKANAAIVPAGTNGAISVFATNPTDVVLDINGYFVQGSGLTYTPLTPCRLVDTRLANGSLGGPLMSAAQTRAFAVQSVCGLPSTAQAYSFNVTVVPRGSLAYLTIWPAGQSQPLVSTLNAFTGAVTANAAIVPAGTAGAVNVFVTNDTDVIIDVNGYFGPQVSGGLSLYTVSPCRVSDTRLAQGSLGGPTMTAGQTRAYPVASSSCGVPTTAQAYSLNATVVPVTTLDYLTLWATGGPQPYVSTLNSFDGSVTANAALVPAGTSGAINAFVTHATELILDINGYFAP